MNLEGLTMIFFSLKSGGFHCPFPFVVFIVKRTVLRAVFGPFYPFMSVLSVCGSVFSVFHVRFVRILALFIPLSVFVSVLSGFLLV